MNEVTMIQLTSDELADLMKSVALETAKSVCDQKVYYKDKSTLARDYYNVTTRTLVNNPWMVPDHGLRGNGWSLKQVDEWNQRPIQERKAEYQRAMKALV
jgi:hypothetical protein